MQPTTFDTEHLASAPMAHMVLVIDDDRMQREILTSFLKRAGHATVLTAVDGKDALECMSAYGPVPSDLQCGLDEPVL